MAFFTQVLVMFDSKACSLHEQTSSSWWLQRNYEQGRDLPLFNLLPPLSTTNLQCCKSHLLSSNFEKFKRSKRSRIYSNHFYIMCYPCLEKSVKEIPRTAITDQLKVIPKYNIPSFKLILVQFNFPLKQC